MCPAKAAIEYSSICFDNSIVYLCVCLCFDNSIVYLCVCLCFDNSIVYLCVCLCFDNSIDLSLPRARTENRKKAFDYAGAVIWNKLPVSIRTATSLVTFEKLVKDFLYS